MFYIVIFIKILNLADKTDEGAFWAPGPIFINIYHKRRSVARSNQKIFESISTHTSCRLLPYIMCVLYQLYE